MTSAHVPPPRLMAAEFFGSAFLPAVVTGADDRKAYYSGSRRIAMRFAGDRTIVRVLGTRLSGHTAGGRSGAVTPKGKEPS